jgi:cell division septation protein DedD
VSAQASVPASPPAAAAPPVETAGATSAAVPAPIPPRTAGKNIVLVGTFANPDNVRRMVDRLDAAGVPYYTELSGAGLTGIRAGPYKTRAEARRASAALNQAGIPGIPSTR